MKNVAAARNNDGATKNKRAREEASPGPLFAEARPLGRRSCGGAPPHPRPTRGHEALTQKARKFNARKICPNLDSRSKTDLETRGKHRELKRKLRAPTLAQSARQGGTEPATTRFRDGRRTTRPPAPRGPAAPALQPRPRGRARPRKHASLAWCKICDFGPELGFEQRNRFRSLRDTRRTKKKVLRKPPAGAPVVGQKFKYIY